MTSTIEKPQTDLPRRLWTAEEYERAGELGLFRPDERLELIQGEIYVKMSSQGSRHAGVISLVAETLRPIFAVDYVIRVQAPLALGPANRPEPDVAVVTGTIWQYLAAHPTTAALIVEVSDTTLAMDQTLKAAGYASAGVPEYWIVSLAESVLEVYRDPANAEQQVYRSVTQYVRGQTITPSASPARSLSVADLLP